MQQGSWCNWVTWLICLSGSPLTWPDWFVYRGHPSRDLIDLSIWVTPHVTWLICLSGSPLTWLIDLSICVTSHVTWLICLSGSPLTWLIDLSICVTSHVTWLICVSGSPLTWPDWCVYLGQLTLRVKTLSCTEHAHLSVLGETFRDK